MVRVCTFYGYPGYVDREDLLFLTEEQLRERGEIAAAGETLSWAYLCWVREHPAYHWTCPVRVLYGSGDPMTDRQTAEQYVRQHDAALTVMEGGEHWFHTPEQLAALREWEKSSCC